MTSALPVMPRLRSQTGISPPSPWAAESGPISIRTAQPSSARPAHLLCSLLGAQGPAGMPGRPVALTPRPAPGPVVFACLMYPSLSVQSRALVPTRNSRNRGKSGNCVRFTFSAGGIDLIIPPVATNWQWRKVTVTERTSCPLWRIPSLISLNSSPRLARNLAKTGRMHFRFRRLTTSLTCKP